MGIVRSDTDCRDECTARRSILLPPRHDRVHGSADPTLGVDEVQVGECAPEVRQPAIETEHRRLRDQAILRAEVVADRSQIRSGALGDHSGGDSIQGEVRESAERRFEYHLPVAPLRHDADTIRMYRLGLAC
jgi:hypothetical protein